MCAGNGLSEKKAKSLPRKNSLPKHWQKNKKPYEFSSRRAFAIEMFHH